MDRTSAWWKPIVRCAGGAPSTAPAGPRWEYGDWNDDPSKLETEVRYLLA